MINSETHQMKDNQFPFGFLNGKMTNDRKLLIKKTYKYKSQAEYFKLKQKIDKLKTISNKNTINLRYVEDSRPGNIGLFYPYVDLPLEEIFTQDPEISVKEIHKQFISLAIFLAKNYILTSFNPNRCGVVVNDGQILIKYYLPLNEIIITPKLHLLERSVQLFNLQSMHYLDILCQSAINTSSDNSSQCSFKYGKVNPFTKPRKESQPVGTVRFPRKFSTNPNINQIRKLSHLSKELSQFSQMRNRRKTKDSTRVSGGSFATLNNLASQKSDRTIIQTNDYFQPKPYELRILKIKQRSSFALSQFKQLKGLIEQHRSLSYLITRIKY